LIVSDFLYKHLKTSPLLETPHEGMVATMVLLIAVVMTVWVALVCCVLAVFRVAARGDRIVRLDQAYREEAAAAQAREASERAAQAVSAR
jgi:hypothetical protein